MDFSRLEMVPNSDQYPAFNPLEILADVVIQDAAMRAAAVNSNSLIGDGEPNATATSDASASWETDTGTDGDANAGKRKGKVKGRCKTKRRCKAWGKAKAEEMEEQERMTPGEVAATGIVPEHAALIFSLEGKDTDHLTINTCKRRRVQKSQKPQPFKAYEQCDFFSSLAQYPELVMELTKHLRINDFVSMYAISKDFNETVNGHISHIMKSYALYHAPESSRIFVFNLYCTLCMPDPVGRPDPVTPLIPRMVPTLKWLRMVLHREKCVRDILACMAREGHRMPKSMSLTIKKMWLTMDIATSARRVQLMHNEKYWTDQDIYNVQLFLIKLDMRFNDPVDGPGDDGLKKLFMGQRGLTPLCKLLKRTAYTDSMEILEAAVRYSYDPKPEHRHLSILGVPANEVGRGHLEGWGKGQVHLYRMDELVLREACRRNLGLDNHMMSMLLWGYVDPVTKNNIQVTEEEMYMSDDDEAEQKHKEDTDKGNGGKGDTSMDAKEDEEWETDIEDMEDESMYDVDTDSDAISASGERMDID